MLLGYLGALQELGVDVPDDLLSITDDDVEELGMRKLHVKKFRAACDALRAETQRAGTVNEQLPKPSHVTLAVKREQYQQTMLSNLAVQAEGGGVKSRQQTKIRKRAHHERFAKIGFGSDAPAENRTTTPAAVPEDAASRISWDAAGPAELEPDVVYSAESGLRLLARVQRGPHWGEGEGEEDGGVTGEGSIIGYHREDTADPNSGNASDCKVGDAPNFSGMCRVVWDINICGEPGPDGFQIHEYKIGRRGKFLLRFSPNQTDNATIAEWARMRALTPQSSACSVSVTDLQIAIKATKREAHALRVGNRPGTEREREQLLLKRRLDELERSLAAAMASDAV
jgi:hypothetical protein